MAHEFLNCLWIDTIGKEICCEVMTQLIRSDGGTILVTDAFYKIINGADFKWLSIVIAEDWIGMAVFQCFHGDWRMPSDASVNLWLEELKES